MQVYVYVHVCNLQYYNLCIIENPWVFIGIITNERGVFDLIHMKFSETLLIWNGFFLI